MNIWPDEQTQPLTPLNPNDNSSGLVLSYREDAGTVSAPFQLSDGRITRAYIKEWRTVRHVAVAAPGYSPASWLFGIDALRAPGVAYQPGSVYSPLFFPADQEIPASDQSVIFRGATLDHDLGINPPPYPVRYFERTWEANVNSRLSPMYQMSNAFPDDPRWVDFRTGMGRMNIRAWNAGRAYTDQYGNALQEWHEPEGMGSTTAYESFTVYEYDTIVIFDWHCPFFYEGTAINIVPAMLTPIAMLAAAASMSGGHVTERAWRRRKEQT